MLVIAILLIIALIGLFVSIGFIIAGAVNFGKDGKHVVAMAVPVKDSVIEIVNTGKGIGIKGKIRYDGYVKHGRRIYKSVKETAAEVSVAAKSINVDDAKTSVQQAVSSINAAQDALAAAKAVIDLLGKTREG